MTVLVFLPLLMTIPARGMELLPFVSKAFR
jgi:hypothetical protein